MDINHPLNEIDRIFARAMMRQEAGDLTQRLATVTAERDRIKAALEQLLHSVRVAADELADWQIEPQLADQLDDAADRAMEALR